MTNVFLSYRREDSGGYAGRIQDQLVQALGSDILFMDVDAIPLGANFVRVLHDEVAKCEVLLAVIGRNWLDARDEHGNHRLENPNDFVRVEIEPRAAAERMGHDIIEVYRDHGISGSKGRDKRPAFDRLHRDASLRKFDVVMAWSVDRLGRSLQGLCGFLSELHALRIDLYLHQQGLDTTTPAARRCFRCWECSPSSSGRSSRNGCAPVWRGPRPGAPRAAGRSAVRRFRLRAVRRSVLPMRLAVLACEQASRRFAVV